MLKSVFDSHFCVCKTDLHDHLSHLIAVWVSDLFKEGTDSFCSRKTLINVNVSEIGKIVEADGSYVDILHSIFREPERKNEAKEPIRRSIRELLARNKVEADAANSARRAEQDQTRKKKQQNMDR